MKLSCLPVSYYPDFRSGAMSISDWAILGQQLGLDAIDLSVLMTRELDRNGLRATASELERIGIPVDTIATYTDFTHPEAGVRDREFADFQADIAAAHLLGATYVRITAGQAHPETARSEGIALVLDHFTRAEKAASQQGIRLLFENHSRPGVWRYCDFAGDPEVYFELVEHLGGAGIDLLFDTANACFYRQDPVSMLAQIYPRVRRIHIADIGPCDDFTPVLVGRGIVPLPDVFAFIKRNHFAGMCSVEEASFTGIEGMKQAFDTSRALWISA